MTANEFTERMLGVPWKRWASDWHECDCWGLVTLYHKHVLGIDVDFPRVMLTEGFEMLLPEFKKLDAPESNSTVFLCFYGKIPTHCGIVIGDTILHSNGSESRPGMVRIDRIRAAEKVYGKLEFYAHRNH